MYHPLVIKRFYVHNFRCLENFELPISGLPSALLIGKNGSGKTSVLLALQILQRIGRDVRDVDLLVKQRDFSRRGTKVPVRIELEVDLEGNTYSYGIAFKFVEEAKRVEVSEERLTVDGEVIFDRTQGEVSVAGGAKKKGGGVRIDKQLVALPILEETSPDDPLFILREWLEHMLILQPLPPRINGNSEHVTRRPRPSVSNLGSWFSGLLAHAPSAYTRIDEYLKQVMPDFVDIRNPLIGEDARSLSVQFSKGKASLTIPFGDLSDGEKVFVICAMVLAANHAHGPLFCFWDEPENYLALSEVGHLMLALRKASQDGGQFIATSHNPEAIRRFSEDNTFVLHRKSHLEPTTIRPLREMQVSGDLVNALIRGDLEP